MMRVLYLSLTLSALLLLAGCGQLRPFHPTPRDALTESPGLLFNSDAYLADSVDVLQRQEVAGGQVLLYRWQSATSQKAGTYCLGATFVTPEGDGWRPQSSGTLDNLNLLKSPLFGCEITGDQFVPAYFVGGNITPLTTAYGQGLRGQAVRISWSDGQIDTVLLKDGSFLLARPETLQVRGIDLLDANGRILEREKW